MEVLTFGDPRKPLVGILESPPVSARRSVGVVLCDPMGHEAFPSRAAMVQLARNLARAGFFVLRFDFYGAGDSSGDTGEGGVSEWSANVAAAISELEDLAGVATVRLVGLRFGATLAALVAAARSDVDAIVLWEPIVDGRAYLRELRSLRARYMESVFPRPHAAIAHGPPFEVMGFPIGDALHAELGQVDLLSLASRPAETVAIIARRTSDAMRRFALHLETLRVTVEQRIVPGSSIWEKDERLEGTLVPVEALRAILSFVEGR